MIRLDLTEEEANLFMAFREHQDDFMVLHEAGVFNVKNGKAILNFNGEGVLTQIDFNILSYRKGTPVVYAIHKFDN